MSDRRMFLRQGSGWLGILSLMLAGCNGMHDRRLFEPPQNLGRPMKLSSSAFEANGLISSEYTCDGQDLSPPLRWDTPPDGTQSLALICDDPDAPVGTFVHWVLYNLSPDLDALPEGVSGEPRLDSGAIQGKNDFRKLGYGGPCPPGGTHRYFFKLYALDTRLDLEPGATKAQLLKAMEGHILGQAELMGRYTRDR